MALKLNQLHKASKNPWSFILSQENNPYELNEQFDTGSYALNAVCSDGDMLGGVPLGKRIAFSGESSTAKSFFSAYIMKSFLNAHEDGIVVLFETEGSSIAQQADEIDIDKSRMIIEPVSIIEEMHTIYLNYLKRIEDDYFKTKERTKVLFVLDSLGMLSSNKEIEDKESGKNTRDMTRAAAIKSMYRAVSLKLSLLQCSMVTVNHSYTNIGGYGDAQIEGSGSGFMYAGDVRFLLTRSQKRIGNSQTGVVIRLKIKKSRWIKENQTIEIELDFEKGMNKHSYLVEWANKVGMLVADDNTVTFQGKEYPRTVFKAKIDKYLGDDGMAELRDKVKNMLGFGSAEEDIENMSVEQLVIKGVEFGFVSDTPRTIILSDGTKIKKKELRSNPAIVPEELIQKIKDKMLELRPDIEENMDVE